MLDCTKWKGWICWDFILGHSIMAYVFILSDNMYWTRKTIRPYVAIAFLWVVTIAFLFFNDFSIITDKYELNISELEKTIEIITDIDETGLNNMPMRYKGIHEREKLFNTLYMDSFINKFHNNIRVETINSISNFVGDIQLSDIPANTEHNAITNEPIASSESISEYKNSKAYLRLSDIDRFHALQRFYQANVVPNIVWAPEHTLSGVFAEMSKDLTYSAAKNDFFKNEVIPEVKKTPALRRVANVIFGLDHSLNEYEARLNMYVLVVFDNNNATFIPYDVEPSVSAENISKYINRLRHEEILEKIIYWSTYAFLPLIILFLLGTIIIWAKHEFEQENANDMK
jgi:hypothetical protein